MNRTLLKLILKEKKCIKCIFVHKTNINMPHCEYSESSPYSGVCVRYKDLDMMVSEVKHSYDVFSKINKSLDDFNKEHGILNE